MADADSTSTRFNEALDKLAHSQMLTHEIAELAEQIFCARGIDEIRGKLHGIAAMAEKSVSLNADASEALQDLFSLQGRGQQ